MTERTVYISLLEMNRSMFYYPNEAAYETLKSFLISITKTIWVTLSEDQTDVATSGVIESLSRVLYTEGPRRKFITLALEADN